jgi:hypothetical protein
MGDFDHIARCLDLQEQDVASAMTTREEARALLGHLGAIAAPNTGAAKVLLVCARMATTACDWTDGDLCIDLVGDEDACVLEVCTELGGGLRERIFPPVAFRAPLAEFARAIDRVPHLIAPLAVRSTTSRRIALSANEVVRRTTAPPPPIAISGESLFGRVPAPALPRGLGDAATPPPEPVDLPVIDPRAQTPAPSPPAEAASAPPSAPPPRPGPLASPSEPPLRDVDTGWDD